MKSYRVIIAGSRTFNDYKLLKEKANTLLKEKVKTHNIIIVSGTASGADKLGERFANEMGYNIERYPAQWNRDEFGNYNKRAGYERNEVMAKVSDALIAFTNGSKGTGHMIDIMKSVNKPCRVIDFE